MALSEGFGLFLAVLSAVSNGTFSVPSKLGPVKRAKVEPYVFNLYMCLGVGITSLCLPLFGVPFVFEWLGILSGFFLSFSTMNAFRAASLLGISIGAGIWCGTAIVVSFIFGHVFDQPVSNLPQGIVALVILILSIAGMAYAERRCSAEAEAEKAKASLLEDTTAKNSSSVFLEGLIAAFACGAFGGLVNAPEHFVSEEASSVNFIPSFGIGVLVSAPIFTAIPFLIRRELPNFAVKESMALGVLSGVIWNISNIASLVAIGAIGFNIALPIMQCGLFVAGLWGIFLFGEIKGRSQWIYWLSSVTLIIGALLLFSSK